MQLYLPIFGVDFARKSIVLFFELCPFHIFSNGPYNYLRNLTYSSVSQNGRLN